MLTIKLFLFSYDTEALNKILHNFEEMTFENCFNFGKNNSQHKISYGIQQLYIIGNFLLLKFEQYLCMYALFNIITYLF